MQLDELTKDGSVPINRRQSRSVGEVAVALGCVTEGTGTTWGRGALMQLRIHAQSPLKPGMVIYVCTSSVLKGPCGQSSSVMASHCEVHIFDDNDSFREWANDQDWHDKTRSNVKRWWMIIGEMHTTGMRVEYHGSES